MNKADMHVLVVWRSNI